MLMKQSLHIVSFDVPFPPNYGGVIDVFYKIKALSELNVDIYLHVFEFGRGRPENLKKYCKHIYYYKRNTVVSSVFSTIPFRAKSRYNNALLENLKNSNAPILFEGLHTTVPLLKNTFANRLTLVRAHNIEHEYLNGLAKSEKNIFKKIFFKLEAIKFLYFEKIVNKTNSILTISPLEHEYFHKKYVDKAVYIPAFHKNHTIKHLSEKGDYILYYGDLRIADNIKSVLFLIAAFKEINYPIIFASSFINKDISKKIELHSNMKFVVIKDGDHLDVLLEKAHINVLPTFQKTGIKLKLINALFNGRFCLVNIDMVESTGLQDLCEIANTKQQFIEKTNQLMGKRFSIKEFEKRKKSKHLKTFNTKENAQKIIDLIS